MTRACISVPAPTEVFMRFGLSVINATDPAQQVTFELIGGPKFTLVKELPIIV